jgi:hypothetical protein
VKNGWVEFKAQWFETDCTRCGRTLRCGERVFVKHLGDDHVEAEHALCPGPNPFEPKPGGLGYKPRVPLTPARRKGAPRA